MRTRDRDQDWIEELGRRRLEALIAELTPSTAPGPGDPASVGRSSGGPVHDGSAVDEADGHATSDRHQEALARGPRRAPVDEHEDLLRGRHARRALSRGQRVRAWVADRLPETARGQGLQQGHVGVLALLLAVAVLLGGWAWLRAAGDPPEQAAAPAVTAPGSVGSPSLLTSPSAPVSGSVTGSMSSGAQGGAPGASGDAGATAEVVVHVAGKVKRPGIVVLRNGSRVIDAVRRAGGFAAGVGPRSAALNLARVLVDGEQIVVGAAAGAAAAGPPPVPGASAGASTGPVVSLNTADQAALETLPGVGPVTAAAILAWRDEHGPFTAVEQLLEVSGIGEKTLAEIQPHVTL